MRSQRLVLFFKDDQRRRLFGKQRMFVTGGKVSKAARAKSTCRGTIDRDGALLDKDESFDHFVQRRTLTAGIEKSRVLHEACA